MAKKSSGQSVERGVHAASTSPATRTVKRAEARVDLIYIDPPFNSNRNYEGPSRTGHRWGETKEKRAFADRHESMMMREDCEKGFFVSFDFTSDALQEIESFFKRSHKVIVALTVKEILDEQIAKKLV
jgi:hypothetical protein